jgi:hypothetical protein
MSSQPEDFIEVLNDAGVEYVVIGGIAMAAQGSAYVTLAPVTKGPTRTSKGCVKP